MSTKPRLLDLFCGAGGAGMGYHRAGFEVVGVDIKAQPHYPFEFHQGDALTFPLDGFDAIHASPPCQNYSKSLAPLVNRDNWNALLDETRARLDGTVHVIENVPGAPISSGVGFWGLPGVMLCGSMFALGIETPNGWREVRRHRLFESPVALTAPGPCRHRFLSINPYNALGRKRDGMGYTESERALIVGMGVDWHTSGDQGREAIPPAYTEWIGRQLLAVIEKERAA